MSDPVKSLNGPADSPRAIPGTVGVPGREFVYVQYDGPDFDSLFLQLVRAHEPPATTQGGAVTGACELTVPDGRRFHAMSYKGDLSGWRIQIESGAKILGLVMARVQGPDFCIASAECLPLALCTVRFY